MTYRVRYTSAAREDVRRLYAYLLEKDLGAAKRARKTIGKGMEVLKDFPFSCRKAAPDMPFLRELLIPFGSGGYVVLFEVTILAVRHQREDDYH